MDREIREGVLVSNELLQTSILAAESCKNLCVELSDTIVKINRCAADLFEKTTAHLNINNLDVADKEKFYEFCKHFKK